MADLTVPPQSPIITLRPSEWQYPKGHPDALKGVSLPAGIGDPQMRYLDQQVRELTQTNQQLVNERDELKHLLLILSFKEGESGGDPQMRSLDQQVRELTQMNRQLIDENEQLMRLVAKYQDSDSGGDPRFHALLRELGQLHAKKAADYGVDADPFANIRASTELGIPAWKGALLRAGDKIKRLWKFAKHGKLANESAEDSLIDLAAYSLIALILLREENQLIVNCATYNNSGNDKETTNALPLP